MEVLSMSIVSHQMEIAAAISVLAEAQRERRRWADAITDATNDRDVEQFVQIDLSVNEKVERLVTTLAEQGGQDGNW
jgi:hypothetical protein